MRKVEVETAEEFLDNIRPNTKITIKRDFSLSGVRIPENPHVYVRKVFDGEEVVFRDLEYVSIVGVSKPKVTVEPRYSSTLNFENSRYVYVEGLVLGHAPDVGHCQGAVINIRSCSDVYVADCLLFGCGTYGFQVYECNYINFIDSEIFDCSYGIFTAEGVDRLYLCGLKMYNNSCYDAINIIKSRVVFENVDIFDNRSNDGISSFFQVYRSELSFGNTNIDLKGFSRVGIPLDQDGLIIRNL